MVGSFSKLGADWVPGTDPGGTTSFTGGALGVSQSTKMVPKNEPLAQSRCFFVVCGLWFVVVVVVTLALVLLAVVVVTVTGFGCCLVFLLFVLLFFVVFCCFWLVLTDFTCFFSRLFPPRPRNAFSRLLSPRPQGLLSPPPPSPAISSLLLSPRPQCFPSHPFPLPT